MTGAAGSAPVNKTPKCPYCGKVDWDGPFHLGMAGTRGKDGRPTRKINESDVSISVLMAWACNACGHVRLNNRA